MLRSIGLDVHRDFCEVAILDGCGGRKRGRVASSAENLQLFAQSLAPDDQVALEVTGNAWEIARILEPHVARVIVVSPGDMHLGSGEIGTSFASACKERSGSQIAQRPSRATGRVRRSFTGYLEIIWSKSGRAASRFSSLVDDRDGYADAASSAALRRSVTR